MTTHRPIYVIALDIEEHWKRPYFGAVPYLKAMRTLDTMQDLYGWDDSRDILTRFLSNATTWRGDKAREIKAEIKSLLGVK